MSTECNPKVFGFQGLFGREVVGQFDGGTMTSDAGGILLREVEARFGVVRQFAACFRDHRSSLLIEHTVEDLVAQRVMGLCLGYEDLSDHDRLRQDVLMATLVGKSEPAGQGRRQEQDRGKALAGKSTLNRMELTPEGAGPQARYKKIEADFEKMGAYFVDVFIQMTPEAPGELVLDLDATDDRIHGTQEGRFFHGYYGDYGYLPLYLFCGDDLLCAKLREANQDASAGALEEGVRIVKRLREAWPGARILVRGDSGFCREEIMAGCEGNGVEYVLGVAKNARLQKLLEEGLAEAKGVYEKTGEASRVVRELRYKTLENWSRERRGVGKAEHLSGGSNPRFVVTSLGVEEEAQELYEERYCGRGEMENRIKEQQLYLFADRTSTHWMRSNQLRLWFSSVAYGLMNALRKFGRKKTELARAQCQTIREKLLKIGAMILVSVRRVVIRLASGYPFQAVFQAVYESLQTLAVFRPLRC